MTCTAEQTIGIDSFFTTTPGMGGKLRTIAEDFIVNEMFQYPPKTDNGPYTIAEVTSRNWENNLLIRALSKRLGISRMRIGFAGTKDKRACSTQLMSFANVPKEAVLHVHLSDVALENIYTSDRPVTIGDLRGNRFTIIIRNIQRETTPKHIQQTVDEIVSNGGFPNFYGVQRFGVIRPITHVVGRYIVAGDFEQAVMSYIANPIKGEDEEIYQLRQQLEQTRDYAEALRSYPDVLSYEKAMLNRLVVNPHDFTNALTALPKNLLTMFVYAHQSYLFNKMLSERLRRKLPLNEALIGDVILPIREKGIDENGILVTTANKEKVNHQIKKGNAVVSGLLIGSDSVFSEGEMGDIEHKIIENEHIDPRDFIIPLLPYLSSTGLRRSLLAPLDSISSELLDDPAQKQYRALRLEFGLQKGSYATSLLREFMKSDDIRNY